MGGMIGLVGRVFVDEVGRVTVLVVIETPVGKIVVLVLLLVLLLVLVLVMGTSSIIGFVITGVITGGLEEEEEEDTIVEDIVASIFNEDVDLPVLVLTVVVDVDTVGEGSTGSAIFTFGLVIVVFVLDPIGTIC